MGCILACRPINNKFENLGRETFLMPVRWSEDGFPYMTQGNETVPLILKRTGVKRDASVTFGNFKEIEDFDNASLGMQWITLRAPATELYSLSDTPGFLTLKCADVSAAEKILLLLFAVVCSIINSNLLPVCCLILPMKRKRLVCCCLKMKTSIFICSK